MCKSRKENSLVTSTKSQKNLGYYFRPLVYWDKLAQISLFRKRFQIVYICTIQMKALYLKVLKPISFSHYFMIICGYFYARINYTLLRKNDLTVLNHMTKNIKVYIFNNDFVNIFFRENLHLHLNNFGHFKYVLLIR